MSENIQATIIMSESVKKNVTHDTSETLMSTLLKNNLIFENFCGGAGKCGRCRVQFLQAEPLPVATERTVFSPDELRSGYRLACMARPKNNCVIRLDFIQSSPIDVVTDVMEVSGDFDLESQDKEARTATESSTAERSGFIIAVDLGTTTIAMQLTDMETGAAVDTYCALNPQRRYGADVLSRIKAAGSADAECAKDMQNSVWEVIWSGVEKFSRTLQGLPDVPVSESASVSTAASVSSGKKRIRCICIAGNTVMEHLLMGLSTESLGHSPFTPVELGLQKCTLSKRQSGTDSAIGADSGASDILTIPVYVLPGVSAFVGGDIVAGLYHCGLLDFKQDGGMDAVGCGSAVLFIDLGTNGEMAITDGSRMIVTATAAGPAFEGGAGAAVQGSDMIALTASLLAKNIIDETGLLAEPYFEGGVTVPASGMTASVSDVADKEAQIHLTQKDIRDLQMAKAAVRAGIEILCEKMGSPKIAKVYLAGGFGYYLDVDAAAAIGLLPENMRECTHAVGNTSLAGAFQIGRDLINGRLDKASLERMITHIESINLAKQEDFESLYLSYLNFPK
ncbi:MAG: ASKHA domain-containing protein [Bacillus sp. (in: Bacteria)]|nr:ASKHA domain-containing protein [Bacillus sp. (in: firmicutes)]MCM1427194.1 ASKHA domain-containing protein [Eubacterium sp.]